MTSPSTTEAGPAPRDVASLTADFAKHGYPPPHQLALLFPRMTAAEQAALTGSIRVNTMREPITMFNGQIADGIARCHSAIELGLRWERLFKTEFEGNEAGLLQFVIDKPQPATPQRKPTSHGGRADGDHAAGCP